jgi:ketosteroid isomerase-like protein
MSREFFENYYRVYNSGDAAALAACYADDVVLVSAEGEQAGREALLATYRFITERFIDRMTPQRMLIDGDEAAIQIVDRFEAKQDVADFLGGSFRRGDTFTLNLCGWYRLEQGRIKRIAIYRA